jgi:hypothetical protein
MTSPRAPLSRGAKWPAALLLAGVTAFAAACGGTSSKTGSPGSGGTPTSGAISVPASTAPPGSTAPATAILTTVLSDAYQAESGMLATYRNVVSKLGSVGPFPNVVSAEEQHVSTVSGLLNRYGVAVPAAGSGHASPATLSAACSLGVSLEQDVVSLYGGQLPEVSSYPDVTTALQNLQAAARDSHLPAFQHCA